MEFKIIALLVCAVHIAVAAWVREMENPGLFEGDMVLRPDQKEALKKGNHAFASVIGYRWPGGVVPYVIDRSIGSDGERAVTDAIADYHKYTCLKFVKRTNQRHYIKIQNGRGCSSPVGYNNPKYTSNGINIVTLGSGCRYKGTAMHEIGHSIGLYHEQSRPDRDNYVEILKYNVYDQNMVFNFNKHPRSYINSLGTPYDYSSMMHYGSTAFGCDNSGRNCKQTIRTKDRNKQRLIGQRSGFSQGDINQIKLMYNCDNSGGGNNACTDSDNNCAYWAGIGECEKNIDWMRPNCKKSCGVC